MKKFLSILCALAVAAALAMPVFAQDTATPGGVDENATPGEVVEDYTEQLLANPGNTELAKQINDMINANSAITVGSNTSKAMQQAIFSNTIFLKEESSSLGAYVSNADPLAKELKLVEEGVEVSGSRVKVSLHFENAAGTAVQPMLGASVTLTLNQAIQAEDLVLVDANNRMIDSVQVYTAEDRTFITFWAPHFSTYTMMPRSEYEPTVPPTTEPTTPPTTEPTTPPTGSTGEDDQPIKATGADMSLAVVAVLAVAGVVIGGGALAAKKNGAR